MASFPAMTSAGQEMHALVARLYPIYRSITGAGLRQTLKIIQEQLPLEIHEVASGTKVFDWTVPKEWNIRDAWVKNAKGERVIDFQSHGLHVVGYSVPIHVRLGFAELRNHLFTVPEHPDWIPYRTSYYKENWGFCLSENQLGQVPEDEKYEIYIDSSLEDGHLTYGELHLEGQEDEEILISCHTCHPSLANDNLSGVAVAVQLARKLASVPHRYSYRFLFVPGTIGAITWLARNESVTHRIRHGLVLTCLGDGSHLTYKRSRRGDAEVDRAFAHILKHSGERHDVIDFFPYGYDERQYCSPGFDLPVGCVMRGRHGQFPEYHTSADDLKFVRPEALQDSFEKIGAILQLLEENRTYVNQNPKCEPQLGRRGLLGGSDDLSLLWVLNLADGKHSLLDIAERANLPFSMIKDAATKLAGSDLLKVR
jgi:aminopeptidase-like protein